MRVKKKSGTSVIARFRDNSDSTILKMSELGISCARDWPMFVKFVFKCFSDITK